ncbi:hypothetical protein KA047_00290 [Candidatus Saccharibacteria bacterium]|nr:hypothetical protein [Candidatus Saccharibacteria bacterium]
MASDRQRFNRAVAHWENLRTEGHFSNPVEQASIAIVSSQFTDDDPDTVSGITELESFRIEALELADRARKAGLRPEVAINATRSDITALIQDPSVATMYMIGNGSLSSLILGIEDRYDWHHASTASNHLKLGQFIQRQCGGLSRQLNVPLGLFVMEDPRSIHAALGLEFYPISLDDPENEKIQPIFDTRFFSYQSIKQIHVADTISGIAETHDQNIAKLKRLAFLQPKISVSDMRANLVLDNKREAMSPYGNFYMRFLEVRAVINGEATDTQINYTRMIKERFGFDLVDFFTNELALCKSICHAIEAKQPYDQLFGGVKQLQELEACGELPIGSAEEINIAANHPLGIHAIGLYYWDAINELLEQAYDKIARQTLNAPFLTR